MPFELWCEEEEKRQFHDVVDHYLPGKGNQRISYKITANGKSIELQCGQTKSKHPIYIDPATEIEYFFGEIPITHIINDEESQPRWLKPKHVRNLMEDFHKKPVHEPSNCRLVTEKNDLGRLLQFDGQHKTTAQIALGREVVQMKVYIDPDPVLLNDLVVTIQQGIKKIPLSTSQTLAKMNQIHQERVEQFYRDNGKYPSEKELIESINLENRNQAKKDLINDMAYLVFSDKEFKLREFAPDTSNRAMPTTEKIILGNLIAPLVHNDLLEEPVNNDTQRDHERENIIWLCNEIQKHMLKGALWNPQTRKAQEDNETKRARVFFQKGAVRWWHGVLIDAMEMGGTVDLKLISKKQYFLKKLSSKEKREITLFIRTLASWSIWDTDDDDILRALRSNTVKNVKDILNDKGLSFNSTQLLRAKQDP